MTVIPMRSLQLTTLFSTLSLLGCTDDGAADTTSTDAGTDDERQAELRIPLHADNEFGDHVLHHRLDQHLLDLQARLIGRDALVHARNRRLDLGRLFRELEQTVEAQGRTIRELREQLGAGPAPSAQAFSGLTGRSPALRRAVDIARAVAGVSSTVLITGESGTGKELLARGIHAASTRAAGPWIALNCATLTESLQIAELFGHAKGAYTGAAGERAGLFEAASGGTLCGIAQGAAAFVGQNTNPTFAQKSIDLSAYAGQTVQVRWLYRTDAGTTTASLGEGWYVDDIALSHAQVPGTCAALPDALFSNGFE